MKINVYTLSVIYSLVFVLIVLNLVRKNKLKEQYALLWILFGSVMVFAVWQIKKIDLIARLLGVISPPNLLFLLGIIFSLALILHLTVVVSKMEERIIRLTQELAIHKHKER